MKYISIPRSPFSVGDIVTHIYSGHQLFVVFAVCFSFRTKAFSFDLCTIDGSSRLSSVRSTSLRKSDCYITDSGVIFQKGDKVVPRFFPGKSFSVTRIDQKTKRAFLVSSSQAGFWCDWQDMVENKVVNSETSGAPQKAPQEVSLFAT